MKILDFGFWIWDWRCITRGGARPASQRLRSAPACNPKSKIQNPKSAILFTAGDASALEIDQSAHALTHDLVDEDEVIILLLRPSLLYVLFTSLGGLLLITVVTLALAYAARRYAVGWNDTQAFALGAALAALRLGWQTAEWLSRVYVLTDRRIISRGGVLRVTVFAAPLRNIQHTSVFARFRERIFGLGTIGFATAGSETYETFWLMVRQPFAVHRIVVDAIRRYGAR